jgi:cytochrome c biogenesis protein
MTVRQLPGFAFRSPGDYAAAMADLHARYDPVLGAGFVDLLERLQLFRVFSSTWFSVGLVILIVSIVVCTLDRTPRLWRQVSDVRVVQPDPFFDPRLPDRAALSGVSADAVAGALRRHRFRVREEAVDGVRFVYGDRNQYTKLATLFTHLGLILFLVAAAITSRFGIEQGLVVAEGDTLTVGPIGTPGLLVVRNLGFEAPGFLTGRPTDFTTDLAVYRDGEEIARKTIRVNDPLAVAGFTFHQNGFGPAPDLVVADAAGAILWSGPVPLTDQAGGFPYGSFAVPGRDMGLELLLQRQADGVGILLVVPYRIVGEQADGSPRVEYLDPMALARGEDGTVPGIDFRVGLRDFAEYTLLIAKNDPGVGLVWVAFGSLITGLLITFHRPRRRVWARVARDGAVWLVGRADRYVDFEREFGRLLDDLVAARTPA